MKDDNKITVLVSHATGNANVRAVLNGLHQKGLLKAFFTTVATFPNTIWKMLSRFSVFKDFERRAFNAEIQHLTQSHPLRELGRMAFPKIGLASLANQENKPYSIDSVITDIDKKVAKAIETKKFVPTAVYAYEDGAYYTFEAAKAKGIVCLYDLPIGYWRSMHRLLKEEQVKRPEWANTLTGFNDSKAKLEKKDKELANADLIFVASSFTKNTLKEFPRSLSAIKVLPYGFPSVISGRKYKDPAERKLKALFVGGLSQRKGIANVFEALEVVKDTYELTVVGRKPVDDCKPLNKYLTQHHWIPSLSHPEVLAQMASHDVLLFPSLFEGYGLVIAEAMSQGTPVITTNRTCGADFIDHGKNGWLVKAGDTTSLIEQMKYIAKNRQQLASVGQEALTTAKRSPYDSYGINTAQTICDVLA